MDEQAESIKPPRSRYDEIDLRSLVLAIWRGKFLVILASCLGFVLGGYYAFVFAKVSYATSATVVQEVDQEPVVDFNAALSGGSFGGGADQSSINTEIQVIKSRGLLELLVAELNLLSDPEFNVELAEEPTFSVKKVINGAMSIIGISVADDPTLTDQQILDAVVDRILDDLVVANLRLTYVFNISISTSSPQKSADIVNTLAELYIANQLDVKSRANRRDIEWLTERVRDLQQELEVAEVAVKDFNAATDLINEETLAALNRQVKELRDRLEEELSREAEIVEKIKRLEAATLDRQAMVFVTENRELGRIFENESSTQTPDWTNFDRLFNEILQRTKTELERLQRQIVALEASIVQQEIAADQQSSDLLRLQQLQREATASGVLYEFFLSRLKETSVQSGIQEPESRILSRAVVPVDPSAPRRVLILASSILVGGIAGVLFLIIRELRISTFRAVEVLENHTNLTAVGELPNSAGRSLSRALKQISGRSNTPLATAIRNLRASVLLAQPDSAAKVFLITSSVPKEGKTRLATLLAQSMSNSGKKVLLLEANLRAPNIAKQLRAAFSSSLTAIENENVEFSDVVSRDVFASVDVAFSKADKLETIDFLSSDRFRDFVNEMRSEYDYVIFDGPAVQIAPDAGILSQYADMVLYLVKWNSTTRQQVNFGLRTLMSFSAAEPRLVLTQTNPRLQRKFGYPQVQGR